MREIKIKFVNKEDCFISKSYTLDELARGRYDEYLDSEKCIKLEYTGLKDKNLDEIYEGDIIQIYRHCDIENKYIKQTRNKFISNGNSATCIGSENDIRQVCYEYGALYLYGNNGGHAIKTNFCNLHRPGQKLEVIGNIYENKELINE